MNEIASDHSLLIGACDWRHAGWGGNFYPDDLPEDWRLGYYGNEFPVVLVPAGYVLDAGACAALEEDSDSRLRFVVEITDPAVAVARVAAARGLGERCAGLFVTGAAARPDKLRALLPHCTPLPVVVTGEELPAEAPVPVSRCWDGEGEPPPAGPGLRLARVCSDGLDPRRLRGIIEALLAHDTGVAVLLFDGTPPDVAVMRQAVVIRDLL